MDKLIIGGIELTSRLIIGTGKYPTNKIIPEVIKASKAQVVTVAILRMDFNSKDENILNFIPKSCVLMPNTSGARNADEAIRIAHIAKAAGCGNWIKIEVVSDNKYLLPDNFETIKATEILVKEGFVVLPYMNPDLMAAKRLRDVGAAAVLLNTAIATAENPILMGEAFGLTVDAGRKAYLSGAGAVKIYAEASSPLTGFLGN
ncbi:thiazole synthase [Clostridium algoriphilum]|uniref:thiazole synthase n=1 Tax=Clostridium algoriphilum TaxID=198347 RepID=UPI001CF39E53|nr:thiazole synthase [Clostridium algoriphilum]MCB2292610.1 thiazole synthase [Clostridium algoriphilum]